MSPKDNKGVAITGMLITIGVGTVMAVSGFFAKAWFTDTKNEIAIVRNLQAEKDKLDSRQTTDIAVAQNNVATLQEDVRDIKGMVGKLLEAQGIKYVPLKYEPKK